MTADPPQPWVSGFQRLRQIMEAAAGIAEAVQRHGDRVLLDPVAQLYPAGGCDGVEAYRNAKKR